ncbi:MAG: glutathione synthase [Alphaproteobacteria bacterium]|nr:glutathione synthase [Alphaproteobacteria bacterium]
MDPLERIQVAGDSTFVAMREATDRGHDLWWCTPDDLYVRDGRAWARAEPVAVRAAAPHWERGQAEELDTGRVDVVWMRKDPPFDMTYVFSTYVLDLVPAPTLVVNHPAGLKLFNEKIWAMHFADFQPPTLLSKDKARLRAFVASQPDGAVLKPWDGNGGRGVVVVKPGDRNLPALVELLTADGRDFVIAQRFLPGVSQGDKRILLFDGDPVGAILRVPGPSDHRANMHVGATVHPTELDARDRAICAALGPELKRHGQLFVGIDVIDGMLTEINVTSPTGLREVEALYGQRLEVDLLDRIEAKVAARRGAA